MYNTCLSEGVFPDQWKKRRLVLIPKGGKPAGDPSTYRPLCMLDTAGKVQKRIIGNRLEAAIEEAGGLSEHQYGFRKARSTVDAIKDVVDTAKRAIEGRRWRRGAKQYCCVITLDVKNAFNTASWKHILQALRNMRVSTYIRDILKNYFRQRVLCSMTQMMV